MHPAQCRNRVPGARNRRPPACGAALDTPKHPVSGVDSSTLQDLLRLQQRLLLLLHHDGPAGAATFGEPAPAGRYFTDLRLIASLICVTWPAARPLSLAALAQPLDDYVAQQRQLIEHARQTKAKILRHAIYDKPPAGSVACAGLLFVADQILTTDQDHNGDRLGELIAGPVVKNWAAHFIRPKTTAQKGYKPPPHRTSRPTGRGSASAGSRQAAWPQNVSASPIRGDFLHHIDDGRSGNHNRRRSPCRSWQVQPDSATSTSRHSSPTTGTTVTSPA